MRFSVGLSGLPTSRAGFCEHCYLSREQWERLLWQCRDQESSGRLGLGIPAPLHPMGFGGGCRQRLKEKASLWSDAQGTGRDVEDSECSEGSQKASCSHCVERRKGNGKGRERGYCRLGPRGEPRIKVEQAGRARVWEQNQEHGK